MVISAVTDVNEAPGTHSTLAVVFCYGLLADRFHIDENVSPILWRCVHGFPLAHAATFFLGLMATERASSVTASISRSSALLIMGAQYCGGMEPRRRIAFAVPYETPMSSANSERDGQRLMICSCVMFETVRFIPAVVKRKNYDLYPNPQV